MSAAQCSRQWSPAGFMTLIQPPLLLISCARQQADRVLAFVLARWRSYVSQCDAEMTKAVNVVHRKASIDAVVISIH
jgi:hypothetical protein